MIRIIPTVVAVIAFASPAWAQEDAPQQEPPVMPGSWRERYATEDEEFSLMPFVGLRAGAWGGNSFEMESITANGPRKISGNTLWNLGLDAGVILQRRWAFWGSFDAGLSNDTTMSVLGGNFGYLFPLDSLGLLGSLPITACISVGGLLGNVHVRNFEAFDYAFGFRAGLQLMWRLNERVMIEGYADARFIQFDLQDQVFAGDDTYGGGSFAAGIGLVFRI
jgi:hypothetical protein